MDLLDSKGFLSSLGGQGDAVCALQIQACGNGPQRTATDQERRSTMFDEIFALTEELACSLCCSSSGGGNQQNDALE